MWKHRFIFLCNELILTARREEISILQIGKYVTFNDSIRFDACFLFVVDDINTINDAAMVAYKV